MDWYAGPTRTRPSESDRPCCACLAAEEHSRAELERKLLPPPPMRTSLAQVLDACRPRAFINEARVVESLSITGAPPSWGRPDQAGTAGQRAGWPRRWLLDQRLRATELENAPAPSGARSSARPPGRHRARQADALSGQPRLWRGRNPAGGAGAIRIDVAPACGSGGGAQGRPDFLTSRAA